MNEDIETLEAKVQNFPISASAMYEKFPKPKYFPTEHLFIHEFLSRFALLSNEELIIIEDEPTEILEFIFLVCCL